MRMDVEPTSSVVSSACVVVEGRASDSNGEVQVGKVDFPSRELMKELFPLCVGLEGKLVAIVTCSHLWDQRQQR